MANVSGANPETWIGMQTASTSRAATSVNTVAPMVTVTASFRSLPSFSTIGNAIRVWEARSDPMSSAPTQGYPAQNPTRSPAVRGSANVSSPKPMDRLRVRLNCTRSISIPAKNISRSLPSSAKNSTTSPCLGAS